MNNTIFFFRVIKALYDASHNPTTSSPSPPPHHHRVHLLELFLVCCTCLPCFLHQHTRGERARARTSERATRLFQRWSRDWCWACGTRYTEQARTARSKHACTHTHTCNSAPAFEELRRAFSDSPSFFFSSEISLCAAWSQDVLDEIRDESSTSKSNQKTENNTSTSQSYQHA